MLPPRIPQRRKRDNRWRSPAHTKFVRSHACCRCGSTAGIEVAHVRLGSNAGLGRKPDDWRTVSLCAACHRLGGNSQHDSGERTFWKGVDVEGLIKEFIQASPKRHEIERVQRERANGA